MSNEGIHVILSKGKEKIVFDRVIKTKDGKLCGVEILPRIADEMANPTMSAKSWDINRMHEVFNHVSEETLRKTAHAYGWTVTGKYKTCPDCQVSHIAQQGVPKETYTRHAKPGGRLFFDLSSVKKKSLGGNKFWLAVVDDATGKTWSTFMKRKSELVPTLMKFIRKLKTAGYKVEKLRCDRAGENFKFRDKCAEQLDLNDIGFEFTAQSSPQFNGRVERKIAVIMGRARTYLIAAGLTESLKSLLWCECVKHATDVENLLLSRSSEDSAYKQFYVKDMVKAEHI